MDSDNFLVWCTVRRGLSPSSINHTKVRLKYLLEWLGVQSLNPDNIQRFVYYLIQKNLRNSSVNGYIRVIYLINLYLKEQGQDSDLMSKINYLPKQEVVPDILTVEEIQTLLRTPLPKKENNLGAKPAFTEEALKLSIYILAATGCRFDEMASLKKENLFLGLESWVIFKKTKNKEERRVPIPPQLANRLKDFVKDMKPTQLIFLSRRGNKMIEQTWNPFLRAFAESAGLQGKHLHAHAFRHSYIMEHRIRKTPIEIVALLCGHRDLESTRRYAKYDSQMLYSGAINHRLFSQEIDADVLLKSFSEYAEKHSVFQDKRFCIEKTVKNTEITLKIRACDFT